MEKEDIKLYLRILRDFSSYIIPVIVIHIIESKFNINLREYIDAIPSIYFTLALIISLFIIIINFSSINQKKDGNILFLASQNDYGRIDTSIGFITFFTIGIGIYAYFIEIPKLNTLLFFTIIYSLLIKGSFLKKTVMIKLKNNNLHYNNDKEKRTFPINEIKEFKIAPNEIRVLYHDNEKLISFLEIKEEDYKEIKSWFQRNLPEIIVSKSKAL
ncbi:hypothetical protein [Tenacibaculum aiptasiae]|uniref:hypothetical protein n=1 Tax=Tenacibaculum aiptasiae TaxID=426481 RepID=UPI002330E140|nr:hypothetical protein [Tenacibaculum aiptasiae]